jgi:transposase
LLPKHQKGRKPIDRRQVINALFYLVRTGCQRRHLPQDFPKWKTVYTLFWRWRNAGIWEKIHDALCRFVRKTQGKSRLLRSESSTVNLLRPRRSVERNAVMMPVKKGRAANAASWSIRWVIWYSKQKTLMVIVAPAANI